jgi:hypothetical protein
MFWDSLYSHFVEQTEKTTDVNQNIVHVLLFGSFNDFLSPFQTNVACR